MTTVTSKQYTKAQQRHPEYLAAVESLGEAIRQAGPIDEKHSHMIQLAASAAIRSEGSVHSHTKRAMAAGAEPEEIYHALILLSNTIGFPNVMAALSWADDVIEPTDNV